MPNPLFRPLPLHAPSRLSRWFGAGMLCLAAVVSAHAQSLPPGVHLGMSAEDLRAALPSAERVPRPQRLSGGLLGSWRGAPAPMAGLVFAPTFFFADAQLRRVEFAASAQDLPDGGAAAFAELLQWGRGAFGAEIAANDPGSAYAAWRSGDVDVYVQRAGDPRHASVRLVYKQRELRDGSEL